MCDACEEYSRMTGAQNMGLTTLAFAKQMQNAAIIGGEERDPLGRNAHDSGSKLDAGKPLPNLVLGGFVDAINAVVAVGTFGAQKYTENGWKSVPNGIKRYSEASERHSLEVKKRGVLSVNHKDGGTLHLAQRIWNDLATLQLALQEQEQLTEQSPQAR